MILEELVEKMYQLNNVRLLVVQLEEQLRDYSRREPTKFIHSDAVKEKYKKDYSEYLIGLNELEKRLEKAKENRDELAKLSLM